MTKLYTLGKGQRLKSRKKIESLFQRGNSFSIFPFKVYWLLSPEITDQDKLEFGVGVGTKHFKKAVDRNRIKRLIREGFRLQKTALENGLEDKQGQLWLFLIYIGKDIPSFELIKDKTAAVLQKLAKVLNETGKTNN